MPSTADYLAFLSKELQVRSELIRDWYKTHHPSAGNNREELVANLLRSILPDRFAISTGLALSASGEFSNQADILIVDGHSNKPFIDASVPVWLIEAVYALVEVKTNLTPDEIKDSLAKCKRFKNLQRNFSDRIDQFLDQSIFILWVYEAPSFETCLKNISKELAEFTDDELPDFIICPSKFLITSGDYQQLAKYGQPGSDHRRMIELSGAPMQTRFFKASLTEKHCFMIFMIWLRSWLDKAGHRSGDLIKYLPPGESFGDSRDGEFNFSAKSVLKKIAE